LGLPPWSQRPLPPWSRQESGVVVGAWLLRHSSPIGAPALSRLQHRASPGRHLVGHVGLEQSAQVLASGHTLGLGNCIQCSSQRIGDPCSYNRCRAHAGDCTRPYTGARGLLGSFFIGAVGATTQHAHSLAPARYCSVHAQVRWCQVGAVGHQGQARAAWLAGHARPHARQPAAG
jgi:hypothetical protein